jgi:hypothetical protein
MSNITTHLAFTQCLLHIHKIEGKSLLDVLDHLGNERGLPNEGDLPLWKNIKKAQSIWQAIFTHTHFKGLM